jgi:ribonuclease HIII
MPKQTSYTYKLDDIQQAMLIAILETGNYEPITVEHTIVAVSAPQCKVSLYKSGKCLIQGKGAEDFVTFIMEPRVLGEARLGYEEVLSPEIAQPHMGVDESGKGDFFGPLTVSAAYVDADLLHQMTDMGLKESKNISSDKKAIDMAAELRRMLRGRFSLVTIGPASYNRLYLKMRSVNRLLAWAHARAIEDLLVRVPNCPRAISDQFGSKQQVINALMKKGRSIELVQRHKAESDAAVAAASVLARAAFLQALQKLEETYEVKIPKGASAAVQAAGVTLAKKHGAPVLLNAAKCHFKTTDAVLTKLKLSRTDIGPEAEAKSQAARPRKRTKTDK